MKFSFSIVLATTIFLFNINRLFAQTGSIGGAVTNAVTTQPLSGASISIAGKTTISDTLGRFRFLGIKPGSYVVTASYVGFETNAKYNVPVTSGNEYALTFELLPLSGQLANVTVVSGRKTARAATLETPLSVQRLTSEEIKANPGGNFDISRVINSLPGVGGSSGTVGGFRNDIIIRGGGPSENVFYLDGIEVPVINHFATQGSGGGPTGILNVSFIEDVKLSTSAFDSRFDNTLSSVFEFKQKTGNTSRTQGNVRLSGTEMALTLEGPLNKSKNLTYLASARRSYLQLLFQALDLPIRPNYWDFQQKITYKINSKSTFTLLGIAAIDEFSFGTIKKFSDDKLYVLNNAPSIRQWSYTVGASYRRSLTDGFLNIALSRNTLDNSVEKFDFNDESSPTNLRYSNDAKETENKLRIDFNTTRNGWKMSYGAVAQYVEYNANNNIRRRAAIGTQPEDRFLYSSNINFGKMGAFLQAGRKFLDNRLGINAGIRSDINTFTEDGTNPINAISPRIAFSYVLADRFTLNATAGRYARLPAYTILGFRDNAGMLVNKQNDYITNTHYVAGVEFLPKPTTRFTLEAFYKNYQNVPVTVRDGLNINNLGADYGVVGNEPVVPTGRGQAYGFELFAQQKLTKRFFGIMSYTFFYSKFSNADGKLVSSAWDNRHLLSGTFGYKFNRNWEIGIKYRFQGGAPFTPFNALASQQNYLTRGEGVLDFSQFNRQQLAPFSSSDLRIDKKWNFKRTTLDLYLDVTNWLAAKTPEYPKYTFQRDLQTGTFITTDGGQVKTDGSNAIPLIISSAEAVVVPTIGFIVEF